MKIIPFRTKSASGPALCADGEIESAVNISFLTVRSDRNDTDDHTADEIGAASGIMSPEEALSQLNLLNSTLRPVVEFALSPSVVPGWHIHPDILPVTNVDAPKNKDAAGWKERAAETLERFLKDAERRNLFIHPFLILTALRLSDGRHILPSPPMLLLPMRKAPTVEGSDNFTLDSMTVTVNASVARLQWRVSVNEELLALREHITHLDIFISDPLPLYHTDEPLTAIHRASGATRPQSWQPTSLNDFEFTARLLNATSFHIISSVRLSQLPKYKTFADVSFNVPDLPDIDSPMPYRPDFMQHHGISAASACRLSDGISLSGLTLTLPLPHLPGTLWAHDLSVDEESLYPAALEVETVKNGLTLHAVAFDAEAPGIRLSDDSLPEWIFVPDADACQLALTTPEATYIFPLQPHPVLNGAIFWCGSASGASLAQAGNDGYYSSIRKVSVSLPTPLPSSYVNRESYRLPNATWRSDKDSSLCFPDKLLSLFGSSGAYSAVSSTVIFTPIDPLRPIALLTRPLKLEGLIPTSNDTASNYKNAPSLSEVEQSLWGIRLIGAIEGNLTMQLFASHDLRQWRKVAESKGRSLFPILPTCITAKLNSYRALATVSSINPLTMTESAYKCIKPPLYYRLKITGRFTGHLEAFAILTP